MVQGEEKNVVVGSKPQQGGAHQRAGLEVERPAGVLPSEPQGLDFGHVHNGKRQARGGRDPLEHGAIRRHGEGSAQRLVAVHQGVQRRSQGRDRERAAQPQGRGEVVGGRLAAELLQEPEPFLGEGGWQVPVPGDRYDSRKQSAAGRLHAGGEPRHGGCLEQGA